MPVLHAEIHHMRRAGGDGADKPVINRLAGLLMRAAEKCVRRAACFQALGVGNAAQFQTLFDGQHQRLFRIGMLARFQDAPW